MGTESTVCGALSKPVNFMAGSKGKPFSVADLKAGVGCIGLTACPGRAATTALADAAGQIDTAPATR